MTPLNLVLNSSSLAIDVLDELVIVYNFFHIYYGY